MAIWLIGKKGTKPAYLRSLLVICNTKLLAILQNKMKLRDKNIPEHIKSIFAHANLTLLEQKRINGYASN